MKLNQTLAIEKGKKSQLNNAITGAYHTLQKGGLLEGVARTYEPVEEGGFVHPSETKNVQVHADKVLADAFEAFADFVNLTATKDIANTHAVADIVVNDRVLATGVPVTHLLFLEKQLIDIRTVINHLPVLDIAQDWVFSPEKGVYETPPVQTVKTKKVYRNHEKAPATDKHPAQVETYTEDIPEGRWTTVKFSGAVPATLVKELLERVEVLAEAVKVAREQANSIDVEQQTFGENLLGFVLNGALPQ